MNKQFHFFSLFAILATLSILVINQSNAYELAFLGFGKNKKNQEESDLLESSYYLKNNKLFEDKNKNLGQEQVNIGNTVLPESDLTIGQIYLLGTGDKIRLTVFGEEDLSGEFEVDSSGRVSLPLIGTIKASGISTRELEQLSSDKLSDGYLIDPRVSIEVLNFRPFFILGEVNEPGSYPYVNGLTVLNAVALSGGFTHRANRDKILIQRGDKEEIKANPSTKVLPGDLLKIQERFF